MLIRNNKSAFIVKFEPDLLRYEHSFFLESKFYFHVNAIMGTVNP